MRGENQSLTRHSARSSETNFPEASAPPMERIYNATSAVSNRVRRIVEWHHDKRSGSVLNFISKHFDKIAVPFFWGTAALCAEGYLYEATTVIGLLWTANQLVQAISLYTSGGKNYQEMLEDIAASPEDDLPHEQAKIQVVKIDDRYNYFFWSNQFLLLASAGCCYAAYHLDPDKDQVNNSLAILAASMISGDIAMLIRYFGAVKNARELKDPQEIDSKLHPAQITSLTFSFILFPIALGLGAFAYTHKTETNPRHIEFYTATASGMAGLMMPGLFFGFRGTDVLIDAIKYRVPVLEKINLNNSFLFIRKDLKFYLKGIALIGVVFGEVMTAERLGRIPPDERNFFENPGFTIPICATITAGLANLFAKQYKQDCKKLSNTVSNPNENGQYVSYHTI